MLVGGKYKKTGKLVQVASPYDGRIVGEVWYADENTVEEVILTAEAGKKIMASLPAYQRYEKLKKSADLLISRKEEWARLIASESGKTIREATAEVERAFQTLIISAEEARRLHGETVPFDAAPRGENKQGFYLRVPVGIVLAITPFNFPLNLACHKVGPALAGGNSVILKPSSYTPLTGVKLGELLLEAGFPPEAVSVLVGPGSTVGLRLVSDPRIRLISLTGSPETGEEIAHSAGIKKLLFELGSNSSVIVDDIDLPETILKRIIFGAYSQAGQVCISIQKLYILKSRSQEVIERLVKMVKALKVGDPLDATTDVGPMIADSAADRAMEWMEEALQAGAQCPTGLHRQGRLIQPVILINADENLRICKKEAFAPVLVIQEVESFEEALQRVNASEYGLQLGIYTENLNHILKAIQQAEVGGVFINDIPTFRVDLMPYGGVKRSGIGREGPRYAVEEMTELRLISLQPLA